MAAQFHLEILTPERAFYVGECTSLVLPTSDGMMGVQAHHTPLTAAIMDGEVSFLMPDGTRQVCAVTQGMADVSDNRVRILCETALRPDEIDEEKERREAQEAAQKLREKQGERDYVLTQLAFSRATSRLRVKHHNI